MQESIEAIHTELQKRLRFETLLAKISGCFVSVPADRVDSEILGAQRLLCELLDLDRSTLWQVSQKEPVSLVLTHIYQPPGAPSALELLKEEFYPWSRQKVMAGETVTISKMSDLPPEAGRDRESFGLVGTKADVLVPLSVGGGPPFGLLTFAVMREERDWSESVVKGLQLIAQVFANALARKRADEALREGETRLRLATSAAGAGLWMVEPETGHVWVTPKTRELFHFAPDEELNYESLINAIHPEDRERVDQGVQQTLQSGENLLCDHRIVRPDGSIRWIVARGQRHLRSPGEPVRVMGVSLDITERKRTEDELRRHHDHLEKMVKGRTAELEQEITMRKHAQEALQRAHDKLEERVKERTANLARANEQLVAFEKTLQERLQMSEIKEKIVDQIFMTLGRNQAVKMKDVFNLVIPALVDIIKIQRCALFSVMENGEQVLLEAGYPEGEHGIGKIFSVKEPYINAVVNPNVPTGDFENHTISYNYILIKKPQKSDLIPPPLKHFLKGQAIHSVLYVPLRVSGALRSFLTFDSKDQHERFSEEEIDILTFFGKELMKGLGLEKMGDILHDFRNPAIAAAAFSKKVKTMLQQGLFPSESEKINRWLDIVIEETSRIQDMGLTLLGEGKEEVLDLTDRLKKRFLINTATLGELGKENIRLVDQESGVSLPIRCFPIHIDRVLDNLLSNATHAIPEEGGELSIRSYQMESWGVAEIINTGRISEEDQERLLLSDGRGRGIHITLRLVKHMGGKLEVEAQEGQTIFRVFLPVAQGNEKLPLS